MDPRPTDAWTAAASYEPFMGRWGRLVAREFVPWLGIGPGGRWLDVGCGTGLLTRTILALAAPVEVVGVDPSEAYLSFAAARVDAARARFALGTGAELPMADETCDAVVSGLVLNFVPDPEGALADMVRVTRPGGTVAAYVWDYADRMQMLRIFWDAVADLFPEAHELDEGRRFPLCQPGRLRELLEGAGLCGVTDRAIEVPTVFRDFDDYWRPFLGGQGPAPGYVVSLGEGRRAALRERVHAALPIGSDGSIGLVARAWAVRGARA